MKILNGLLWFLCTLIFLVIGLFLIALGAHIKGLIDLSLQMAFVKDLPNLWLIMVLAGALIIVIGFFTSRITIGKFQREKTIAFNNPEGQVTISLLAVEDFIKKITKQIKELKDIRCSVVASKRGIDISAKVTLWSDINIPATTERVQALIKSRVQDMLGIEENITVGVHITKIAHREESAKKEKEEPEPSFRGSIEYKLESGKKKKGG